MGAMRFPVQQETFQVKTELLLDIAFMVCVVPAVAFIFACNFATLFACFHFMSAIPFLIATPASSSPNRQHYQFDSDQHSRQHHLAFSLLTRAQQWLTGLPRQAAPSRPAECLAREPH